MKKLPAGLSLVPFLFLLGSCASTATPTQELPEATEEAGTAEEPEEENSADAAADQEKKIEELTHKLRVAQIKLDMAMMDVTQSEKQATQRVTHAEEDVQMAEARTANFVAVDLPNRSGRAELSLQGAKERALEADEELQQLEIMYKDQNLEDMTREFVIGRGRRRAARAAASIAFQELDNKSLLEHQLPLEQHKLSLATIKAQEALASAMHDVAKGELNRQLKIGEAERSVAKAKEALEEAKEEGPDA